MNPAFSLEGKWILITGGGTGLGRAMAQAVVKSGGSVVITGRSRDPREDACRQIGPRAHYLVNDICDRSGIPALLDTIESQ